MSINYSFIIPHRNSPELLKRCVGSIPQRDDVQIIVVDDNSDVNLKPDIDRKGVTVKLLTKQEAKGAGHARNIGIEMAQGKWLFFADADDYYTDELLQFLIFHKDSNADVIYFNYNRVGDGEILPCKIINKSVDLLHSELDTIKFKFNAPWNKMVKRHFVKKYDILFEEVVNGNDMFFTFQVGYMANQIEVENAFIYNYDTSTNGMTNKKKNNAEYYLCRLNHAYQLNSFYSFIGHKEWTKLQPLKLLLSILFKKGWGAFFKCLKIFLYNFFTIKKGRNLFVDIITEKCNLTEAKL